jgi:hypothetical protein
MTITSTPNEIKSHKDPPLAGADGLVAAAGVLTGSEEVLAVAAGVVVVSTAGVLTGSEDELAVTAGVVVSSAAGVADRLRECAGSRFG